MGLKAGFSIVLIIAGLTAPTDTWSVDTRSARPSAEERARPKGTRVGVATYYGKAFEGRKTASGEIFDKEEMVAAHPSYPIGTRARVTNLANGRSQVVRIIDRGPAQQHRDQGVIIDLSEGVATKLGFRRKGKQRVKVEVLEWGEEREEARVGSLR
jgi:rare lipoprotein A